MLKLVEKVEEGFEPIVEALRNLIDDVENAKSKEIEEVLAPINAKYASRLEKYTAELNRYVSVEEVEVPEEEVECEVAEEANAPEEANTEVQE